MIDLMIKYGPLFLMLCLCGCSAVGEYLEYRALDLTDVVDPKYGWAYPLCAKVEVTDFLATGLGASYAWNTHEWFGRRLFARDGGYFAHLVILGLDDIEIESGGHMYITFLGLSGSDKRPPLVSRFRVGGELMLGVHLGLYANLGEVVDFIFGFGTIDIAFDDGVRKGAPMWKWGELMPVEELSVRQAKRKAYDSDPWIRSRAIRKLYDAGDPDTVDALIHALQDSDDYNRRVSALALGKIGSDEAVEPLIATLVDYDRLVAEAALESLRTITGADFGYNPAKWKLWWRSRPVHE